MKVYIYLATTPDGRAKLLRAFGSPQPLDALRDTTPRLVKIHPVHVELGANHGKLVATLRKVKGVSRVQTPADDDVALQGDPLDGEYLLRVDKEQDWEMVLPQVKRVFAKILNTNESQISMEDYTFND